MLPVALGLGETQGNTQPTTEKGGGEASACCSRREGHCVLYQVEEHMQLFVWLVVKDGKRTCCNSILLQVKGFCINHLESKWAVLPLVPDCFCLLLLESQRRFWVVTMTNLV